MMDAIAKSYVLRNDDGARQEFTIRQIARDAVELRYDASGSKIVIQVELIAGYEILKAIERKTRCLKKIDYSRQDVADLTVEDGGTHRQRRQ